MPCDDETQISVPDITETGGAAANHLRSRPATSAELYRRWERQQWSVAAVHPVQDAEHWLKLSPFVRDQVLTALAELEVGEDCVTRTLGALVNTPPTDDDRIFLCTQMADEARHVRFFETYLAEACGVRHGEQHAQELEVAADYGKHFAPVLTAATQALHAGGGLSAWYRALVVYHLMGEGVLGAASLRSIRQLAQRLGLPALQQGLSNVIRDESRHVSFGIQASAAGVAAGHGATIRQAHLESVPAAALVLVGPGRHSPVPGNPDALAQRAGQLQKLVDIGRERLKLQVRTIGLQRDLAEIDGAWTAAVSAALDAYEHRWNAPHPIRAWEAAYARGARHSGD